MTEATNKKLSGLVSVVGGLINQTIANEDWPKEKGHVEEFQIDVGTASVTLTIQNDMIYIAYHR